MTGLVMEVKNTSVVVMTSEGGFEEWRIDSTSLAVGQEIEKPVQSPSIIDLQAFRSVQVKRVLQFAAALLIAVGVAGTGTWAYFTPYGYVNVDINPSVELTYNRLERVIDVKGLNLDGDIVLSKVDEIKNRKVSKAVIEIIETSEEEGFIEESKENYVLVTTTSLTDDSQDIEDEMNVIEAASQQQPVQIHVLESNIENYEESVSEGVSPGKKMLVEKAKELLKDIDESEDLINTESNLGQIMKSIKTSEEKKQNKKDKNKDNKDVNGANEDGDSDDLEAPNETDMDIEPSSNKNEGQVKEKDKDKEKDKEKDNGSNKSDDKGNSKGNKNKPEDTDEAIDDSGNINDTDQIDINDDSDSEKNKGKNQDKKQEKNDDKNKGNNKEEDKSDDNDEQLNGTSEDEDNESKSNNGNGNGNDKSDKDNKNDKNNKDKSDSEDSNTSNGNSKGKSKK